MRRLYWLIQSIFNPVYNDEYRRLGEGEYLAKHGVSNDAQSEGEDIEEPLYSIMQKHEQPTRA